MIGKFTAEVKVGFFVLITVLGLIYLSVRINRHGFSLKSTKTYHLVFSSASGVIKQTPVEYAGIRVGFVEGVSLSEGKARVTIKVEPGVPVYHDSYVGLANRGILGEKIITISGGGKEPELADGGIIEAQGGSGGLDEAFKNFNDIAASIKDLIQGGDGKPSLRDVIGNVTDISEDLRTLVRSNKKEMNDIVKNVHEFTKLLNDGDLKQIVVNLRSTSDNLKSFVKDADPQLRDVVKDFGKVMAKIDDTVSSLNRIVAKVEKGEGTVGRLLSDDTTANKINDTLDGVNDFVGRMKRLEIAVGFKGEYLSSAAQMQSIASFRLQPNRDKYFLFEFTDGPIELANEKVEITTTETGGATTVVKEGRRKNTFSFTALFAQRFYDFTLKAGLIRSTGGVGAEYHLWRDRISIGTDLFDFSRDERLHWRAYAALHLFKIFHFTGGVDDIVQRNGHRNYFAGAGIMLTDNDLKSLVGLAPLVR